MSSPDLPQLLDPARFLRDIDGKPVRLFTLRNQRGMVVCVTNYGAKIEQVLVPDREGRWDDVVLGYDSIEGVVGGAPSVGAFVGRYAGRIENARFTLGGTEHQLAANNGPHCLHGGLRGSRFQVFDAVQHDASSVEMRYVFSDGEEGFPGTLALRLLYRVTEANELALDYEAVALDAPTMANFTTHAFFNLESVNSASALGHEVMIRASRYFEMSPELIATGKLLSVEGTPFDLRQPTSLDTRVGKPQAAGGVAGYDDCFAIDRNAAAAGELALCARVSAPASGRVMEVWSSEPTMQFYTGMLAGEPLAGGPGKGGRRYVQQQSLCFEPQGYPNAPNIAAFPSALHLPGQARQGRTLYRFSTA
ncbi:galactose mutarotase-like enzyme [Polaromonas sp. CF318]|uniref:aldose epimerase family protein n=1 Tax=Polaromonas sp. CF318 TaxID=1144318 RepID=UPI0002714C61|nr:aldose epimerase family protein [Polaromonas sp. CF318]EJL83941.1 galactose mutarotase-like enzyme [Polaromonas sp. CF318]